MLTPNMWRSHVSVNFIIIGSGNGLLPVYQQATTWTTAEELMGEISSEFTSKYKSFIWR